MYIHSIAHGLSETVILGTVDGGHVPTQYCTVHLSQILHGRCLAGTSALINSSDIRDKIRE